MNHIYSYTIFLIPKAMWHLLSPLFSSSLLPFLSFFTFSVSIYLPGNLTNTLQKNWISFHIYSEIKYPQKALAAWPNSMPFVPEVVSGLLFFFFNENYIQSCNLRMTITILAPETLYCCALLAFLCHIVMITCVG